MQDDVIITEFAQNGQTELSQQETTEERIPTHEEIINAPEEDWRRLCALADADEGTMLALRVRRQLKESGQLPERKRSGRRSRPRASTSRRNWSAASVLSRQGDLVGSAMVELIERVNADELDGDRESRSILVTVGGTTSIMEVVT